MAGQPGGMSLPARLAREVSHATQAVVGTRSLAYPRIVWRSLGKPRRTPAAMRFPFGRIHYLDAKSLRTIYRQIFVEGIYQVNGLGDTPTIIDCGGNIGLSVIAFKQRYPHARVLTFEADPALAEILAQNVKALKLSDVTVEAKAVGGENGEVTFLPDGAVGGHVVESDGATTSTKVVRVPMVRLSDWIDGPVDLLKMDIEGSEFEVIAELSRSGKLAQVKTVICEMHGNPATQRQFGGLWQHLTDAGFRLSLRDARLSGDPHETTPFPVIPGKYYAAVVYAWRP